MILGGSFFQTLRYLKNFTPEEDFYHRLLGNPVYPFQDLGNGFYYIRLCSDQVLFGAALIISSILFIIMFAIVLGLFSIPVAMFLLGMIGGAWSIYGNMSTRELIVSRLGGYLLRIQTNGHVLCEQEIFNIYIRLQKKVDSVQARYYYLILGGYLLDDIRISRLSMEELPMRLMGRRLARNLGINYFDYLDDTPKHLIFQYRGYSTLKWKTSDVGIMFEDSNNRNPDKGGQLSLQDVKGAAGARSKPLKSDTEGKEPVKEK